MTSLTHSYTLSTVATAPFTLRSSLSTVISAYSGLTVTRTLNYLVTGSDPVEQPYLYNWRSDYTQIIANNFQPWNVIRNYTESTGQLFINSMACEVDEMYSYWRSSRKNLWLETCNSSIPYYLSRTDLPDNVRLEGISNNLIFNGGLNLRSPSLFNIPDGWTTRFAYTTGLVSSYTSDSVIGGQSVKLRALNGQRCYFGQHVDGVFAKGNAVCLSLFYKTPVNKLFDTNEEQTGATLKMVVLKNDGSHETFSKTLRVGTSYKWVRDYLTTSLEHDARGITVSIEIDNDGPNTLEYYIDGIQLELGNRPTKFIRNQLDQPEFLRINKFLRKPAIEVESWDEAVTITGTTIGSYPATGYETSKTVYYGIPNDKILRETSLFPTSINHTTGVSGVTSVSTALYGVYADNLDSIIKEKAWAVTGNYNFTTYPWPDIIDASGSHSINNRNIIQRSILDRAIFSQDDIYSTYTDCSNDPFMLGSNYSLNIEAFTISEGKIWALCNESYTGTSQRVLKLMYPRFINGTGSLQCIVDYPITGLSTGGTVTSIGFLETDHNRILVSMTGNIPSTLSGSTIDLKYEYYWIDQSNRQVFLRDKPNNHSVIIT
jgi:hypothetical protein